MLVDVGADHSGLVSAAVAPLASRARRPVRSAAVTIELCGSVDHDGPCRWPNNHDIDVPPSGAAVFRTLFVAPEADVEEVHARVSSALGSGTGWSVVSERRRPLTDEEKRGAAKLSKTAPKPE